MGRSTTPKYAVEYRDVIVLRGDRRERVSLTDTGWNVRESGRPTDENLERYVREFEDSTLPGGVNEHLGVTRVGSATIYLNDGSGISEAVASYAPAAFQVVS
jgi:hypothetical protein